MLVKPLAAPTIWIEEFRLGRLRRVDVIKEAAIDELLRDDCFVTIGFGQVFVVAGGKLELVFAKTGDFFEIIVAGIGTGKSEASGGIESEVELGGEFQVNELSRCKISNEEVEFAQGGVDVFLNLDVLGEEIVVLRKLKKPSEDVFVEMSELLLEIERRDFGGKKKVLIGKGPGFGEVSDEERSLNEAFEESPACQEWVGSHVTLGIKKARNLWIRHRAF